jgi:hypothetical protein
MSDDSNNSHLRVFLSVDQVGSTHLKNRLNHQQLYESYQARLSAVSKLREQNPDLSFTDESVAPAILESLGVSTEDVDWATVVGFVYESFHSELSANLAEVEKRHHLQDLGGEPEPWKALGDELIYQFVVRSRIELHWITVAFLAALRKIDRKIWDRGGAERALRIKGSGWVAGFPVRNRIIRLPGTDSEIKDYLGPDIDTGFRIGKCTQPGMLVVSAELAELLSEAPGHVNPLVGKLVAWKRLKGVWDDKHYPIIWVDLPSGYPGADGELSAQTFDPWQQAESDWCKTWESPEPEKRPLRDIEINFQEIRDCLPNSLGIVDPYIIGDPNYDDLVPIEHQQILNLLKQIESHQAEVQNQDAEESLSDSEIDTSVSEAEFDELFQQDEKEDNSPSDE